MPFPENRIFPQKIREISRPENLGTSSSQSRLSTDIRDWLFPGLFEVGNIREFPNTSRKKLIILILALVKTFPTVPTY